MLSAFARRSIGTLSYNRHPWLSLLGRSVAVQEPARVSASYHVMIAMAGGSCQRGILGCRWSWVALGGEAEGPLEVLE